jgi:hypothetical protein
LVLQRAGDQKLPYRPYWVYENPDVLFVRRTKLLRESWDEAMHMVRGENKIIALMEGRVEMPGAIIPPEYVYEMHHAFPHLKHLDPIHHISRRELAEDFETIKKERLWNHQHLVVVGDEGHPALAIAHWGLVACDLEADKEGHLRFKDAFAQYAFSGEGFRLSARSRSRSAIQTRVRGFEASRPAGDERAGRRDCGGYGRPP